MSFKKHFKQTLIFSIAVSVLNGCVSYAPPQPPRHSPADYAPAYTPPPEKYKIIVTPPVAVTSNQAYEASIEPVSKSNDLGLYEAFILKVKNSSNQDIQIDWNKTLFIDGGQTNGGFMFEGVQYSKRTEPKSPDVIFPGTTFEKIIFPNTRVYYLSGRYSGWGHNELGGDQGVYLTVLNGGKEISSKLLINVKNIKP